jgi:predicted hydrolase (HD superfamily)
MNLPTLDQAKKLLEEYVPDEYQRYHAQMVGTAMKGYARLYSEDENLWYLTGYLHDIDFHKHPDTHPGESLKWFKEWNYPEEMIHVVEAHAYGYNGFTTLPQSKLASALLACDEICGIFYAYQKINPIPFKDMKLSSLKKRFNEKNFAAKIDRGTITRGCEALGVTIDEHIQNLIYFLAK